MNALLLESLRDGLLDFDDHEQEASPQSKNWTDVIKNSYEISGNEITGELIKTAVTETTDIEFQSIFLSLRQENIELCNLILKLHPKIFSIIDEDFQTVLHKAAKQCDLEMCMMLVESGAKLNVEDICEDTPLMLSSADNPLDLDETRKTNTFLKESAATTEFLLQSGADVNTRNVHGFTPLMAAVRQNRLDNIKLLDKYGADYSSRDENGNTILLQATFYGSTDVFQHVLAKSDNSLITAINEHQICPLHVAIEMDDKDKTKDLLISGADVNQNGNLFSIDLQKYILQEFSSKSCDGFFYKTGKYTPLRYAVAFELLDMVKLLIEHKCDVNASDTCNMSPLHVCAYRGYYDMAQYLIQHGADMDEKCNPNTFMMSTASHTPLSLAVDNEHDHVVKLLLDSGCDVNVSIKGSNTVLHHIVSHPTIVEMLIKYGADVNSRGFNGQTPLWYAVMGNFPISAEILLQNGADMDVNHYMDGQTVLHQAVELGTEGPSLLDVLLKYDAPVDTPDEFGNTPLLTLVRSWNASVQCLIKLKGAGCDVHRKNDNGQNCLFVTRYGAVVYEIIKYLAYCGVNPDIIDSSNRSPLMCSIINNNTYAVLGLLKINCNVDLGSPKPIQKAIVNELFTITKMLYLTGCDMNPINIWVATADSVNYMIPIKMAAMREWVKEHCSKPPMLRLLCRAVIRRNIGLNPSDKIQTLPVPHSIKRFLDLVDLEETIWE